MGEMKTMNKKKVLVTGGSGLVGNALQRVCPDAVYVSSKDYDLTKEAEVKAMFEKYRSTYAIHLAAKVGGIADNINHPAEYIYQKSKPDGMQKKYWMPHDYYLWDGSTKSILING